MTPRDAAVRDQTLALAGLFGASTAVAQIPDVQEPSSNEDIQRALTEGVPLGRWKEGLLFEGIEPQPWLKSAANYFPGTEPINPEEMRITFMGTSPMVRRAASRAARLGSSRI